MNAPLHGVVGMGGTGMACARWYAARGERVAAFDDRVTPAMREELAAVLPDAQIAPLATLAEAGLADMAVSPGVPLSLPAIQAALVAGVVLTGDIDLFQAVAGAPVVAITGSNGKSTVTTLVGVMAEALGLNVGVGGNLGTPCLDLLEDDRDLYVLEVSSFQLETTRSMNGAVSALLNITPDHLDRYPDFDAYRAAKLRIFEGCSKAVIPTGFDRADLPAGIDVITFGDDVSADCAVLEGRDGPVLRSIGWTDLPLSELRLSGRHNALNAAAALAIGRALDWPLDQVRAALTGFGGLPHRCETIADIDGVTFINDSKATNPGAVMAAVTGLADAGEPNIVLLLGGVAKEADFAALAATLPGRVAHAVLFGVDAELIEAAMPAVLPVTRVATFDEAIAAARQLASAGQVVLLSPACASFDEFSGFEARGEAFARTVREFAA